MPKTGMKVEIAWAALVRDQYNKLLPTTPIPV